MECCGIGCVSNRFDGENLAEKRTEFGVLVLPVEIEMHELHIF